MSTWREKARKLAAVPQRQLTELTKPPSVSSVSPQNRVAANFPANDGSEARETTYGTGRDSFGYLLPIVVTCGDCRHFTRNPMNPETGIGSCELGEPDAGQCWPHSPGARRCCPAFERMAATDPELSEFDNDQ